MISNSVEQKLKEFNNDIELFKLKEKYGGLSFFDLMSIARSENPHSAFLSWMLEGKEIPVSEQHAPLMKLLHIILERAEQQNKQIDSDVRTAIMTNSLRLHNIVAKKEKVIGKLGVIPYSNDRIDIYITCDVSGLDNYKRFEFIIENKIDSKEGNKKQNYITLSDKANKQLLEQFNQDEGRLNDYKQLISKYNGSTQTQRYLLGTNYTNKDALCQFYIYLTPISSYKLSRYDSLNSDEKCESERFIQINYQDLVDYIIDPLMVSDKLSDRVRVFLREYLNNLSMPCLNDDSDEDDKKANYTIMATQRDDTNIIKELWEKYNEIIIDGCLLYKPIKVEKNGNIRSRQQLLNDVVTNILCNKENKENLTNIFGDNVVSTNKSYHVKLNDSDWYVVDVLKNVIYLKQNQTTSFEELIKAKEVYKDLYLQYSFFKENEKFIMASMRILADLEDPKYNVLRAILEVYSNPKNNLKYKVTKNSKVLNKVEKGKIIGLNKREVIICFITNLGIEFDDGLMTEFNNFGGLIVGSFKGWDSINDKNKGNYEKYRWIANEHRYEHVTDDGNFDLFFSNNKWGCREDGKGGFDKFMKLIQEKRNDWKFEIESLTPGSEGS